MKGNSQNLKTITKTEEKKIMLSEMEVAETITELIESSDDKQISLLEIVKKAVPELAEESIKSYMSFLVNGKAVNDWATKVGKDDVVKVIPRFAGGQ